MNAMDLFTAPLAEAIGWALLHLLWQAAIAAGILAAALALLSRHSANVRYGVTCSALVLVFAMFVATAYRSYESRPAPMPPSSGEGRMVPVTKVPVLLAAAVTDSWRDRAMRTLAPARAYLPAVVALWLFGVIVLSARLLLGWQRARGLVHHNVQPASGDWQQVVERLAIALGLRSAVRLVESAAIEVPSVIGFLRPVILLPASALTGMTPQQLEMVLAHELAHVRRHDFLVNLLQSVVETLMFYHPAVWWMSRQVRIERENCCDDLAVAVCGDRIQYARALTRLEELRSHAPAMTVAANGGSLIERVRRLVRSRAESTGWNSRWAAAVAMLSVVVIAIAIPSLPALAEREPAKKPAPKRTAPVVVVAPAATPAATAIEVAPPAPADIEQAIEATPVPDVDVDVEVADAAEPGEPATPAPPAPPSPMAVAVPRIAVAPRVRVTAPLLPPAARPAVAPRALVEFAAADAAMLAGMGDDDAKGAKFGTSGKLTVDELIALHSAGVTPDYVQKMRSVFPDVTLGQVVGLAHMGVTAEYVAGLRAAGVDIRTSGDARRLAAMGVTAEFVKKLAAAGYANLSVKELARLAAAGIDEQFIREMSKYRDKD